MGFTVYARMKRLGKQKRTEVAPVPFVLEKRPETVRELLCALVSMGVKDYNERKDSGQILPYLTKEEIEDKAAAGKVSFGLRNGEDADEEKAVENALQCFEDGIYRVFAGEDELTELEQRIPWENGGSLEFSFIRLTMLSSW